MASIQKRGNSFRITVSCGYDIHGKKLIETTTFVPDSSLTLKKQEKAAQEFALDFERKVKAGLAMDGGKLTLKEFSDRWIDEYAKVNLQPGTVLKYKQELRDKILPVLGHLKLTELRPHIINRFYNSLLVNTARKDGKPGGYSLGSIRKTHNTLSSILNSAVRWEAIDQNPCRKVTIPSAPDTAENIKFFTPEQAVAFLEHIEQPHTWTVVGHSRIDDTGKKYTVAAYTNRKEITPQLRILFSLAIYTGMRKGELLALTWDDIDFENNTITVSKSLSVVEGTVYIKRPKTRTSIRSISIPHILTDRLLALRAEQKEYIDLVQDYWHDNNLIFTQDNGRYMSCSTPYHALQVIIKDYNSKHEKSEQLPLIPFHGLRHTSATLLIAGQQDVKTVSARLGHAQTSTTLNIYTHALKDNDRCAADALESILSKPPIQ